MENKENIKERRKDGERFLKRKTKRDQGKSFKKKEIPIKNKPSGNKTPQVDKFSQIEVLFRKAKTLYEDKSAEFDLDKIDMNNFKNKDKKWTADILKSGTLEDKISALALYIKKNPYKCLKYVDVLVKMAKKKNRRQTEACMVVLKDIFLENLLTNKKLMTFYNAVNKIQNESNKDTSDASANKTLVHIPDDKLIQLYIEDFVHKKYSELLEIIQEIIINDPLAAIKKKYLNILLEMIRKKPEKEEKILDLIVNKLGDPEVEITNYTIKMIKDLQSAHPKMSLIILKNIQNFISKIPDTKTPAKFYALVAMTQMHVINDKDFLEYSLQYFFDLFNVYANISEEKMHVQNKKPFKPQFKPKKGKKSKKQKEDPFSVNKFLSLIVKRINMICKFSAERNIPISKLLDEKINTLFLLSHSTSVKLRVEVLKLIFMMCKGVIQGKQGNKSKDAEANIDRYYKSLYEILLMKDIIFSKHLRELLKVIMMSLSFDSNIPRVAAFLKRALQVCLVAEPPFITCILIIVSQILRNRNKLWKMVDKSETSSENFDFTKRDPKFTNADIFPISELILLKFHYHPSVQRFTNFILENYNKDIIGYEGDPLIDFSLVNFLEKFMLKNPKIKKDKPVRKSKEEREEENLKKFMGEEEKEPQQITQKEKRNGGELEFIKIFNEIEKVKSVKYEKNQEKKKKKLRTEEDVEGGDIEDFADKVIEKEYEKYDKDVDEDEDIDLDEEDMGEEDMEDDYEDFEEGEFEEAEFEENEEGEMEEDQEMEE